MLWQWLKIATGLLALLVLVFVGYAIFVDPSPPEDPIIVPVEIDAN